MNIGYCICYPALKYWKQNKNSRVYWRHRCSSENPVSLSFFLKMLTLFSFTSAYFSFLDLISAASSVSWETQVPGISSNQITSDSHKVISISFSRSASVSSSWTSSYFLWTSWRECREKRHTQKSYYYVTCLLKNRGWARKGEKSDNKEKDKVD